MHTHGDCSGSFDGHWAACFFEIFLHLYRQIIIELFGVYGVIHWHTFIRISCGRLTKFLYMRHILKILVLKLGIVDVCPADSPYLLLLCFNGREERLREQLQFLRKPGIIDDTGYTRFQYIAQRIDQIALGPYRRSIGFLVDDPHRADTIIYTFSYISYSRKGDLQIRSIICKNLIDPNKHI